MPRLTPYRPPAVSDLGDLREGTGWFGTSGFQDVLVGTNGQVIMTGLSGSTDACFGPGGEIMRDGQGCTTIP